MASVIIGHGALCCLTELWLKQQSAAMVGRLRLKFFDVVVIAIVLAIIACGLLLPGNMKYWGMMALTFFMMLLLVVTDWFE